MKKKFWNSDKIVAISAIAISLLTLFIFIKQTNIIEKQSHLSAMPYLMMEVSMNEFDSQYRFDLVNYGVGPAIINKVIIIHNKKRIKIDLRDFLSQLPGMDSITVLSSASMHRGLAIPAGGSRLIYNVGGNPKDYSQFKLMLEALKDNLDYEIYYQSIYDDHWSVSASNEVPKEIN
ncbi:hypothetical protein ABN763_12425 [Spongiivirga sp. MCCC 1A20706]|uniref:hypothetical protein n=1 Tax=Spongiivirga sp. MCCC 1A20706 TaxID=3160963 RepID=UPI003977C804